MTKGCISNNIVVMILQEINRENWSLYFEELFENILLDYITYDHDQFTMTTRLHIGWHWHYLHNSAFIYWYCYRLYCPVIWFTLSDNVILDINLWSCLTELHTVLHSHWLIKLTKPGLLGETGSRGSERCAWKGGSSRALPHVILCSCDLVIYARTYYMLHDTWVQ